MTKSSIAVIVLALLLVLSLCLGITGAWFSDYKATETATTYGMKFGNVTITSISNYTTVHNKNASGAYPEDVTDASDAETYEDNGVTYYRIVAGTRIATGLQFVNASTVDAYYIIVHDGHNYVIANNKLVEVAAEADEGKVAYGTNGLLAEKAGVTVAMTFTLVDEAHNGSANSGGNYIWNVTGVEEGDLAGVIAQLPTAVAYDQVIDLGNYLFNGIFEVRAMQASNVTAAQAFYGLTAGWVNNNVDAIASTQQP